jgi:ribosomal protein S18 acetylase RimI-like enzyme
MIRIRELKQWDARDLEGFYEGYTSNAKYFVSKTESHDETVIRLRLGDLPRPYVKRIERTPRYDEEVFQQGFSFAAYDGDRLVGIIIAGRRDWNRSLWVWDLDIRKSHQRRGIGTRLLGAVVDRARSEGLRVVVCETQNTNTPAIQFYRSMGFEMDGIDLSYYTNEDIEGGEVAIFMKLKLWDNAQDP